MRIGWPALRGLWGVVEGGSGGGQLLAKVSPSTVLLHRACGPRVHPDAMPWYTVLDVLQCTVQCDALVHCAGRRTVHSTVRCPGTLCWTSYSAQYSAMPWYTVLGVVQCTVQYDALVHCAGRRDSRVPAITWPRLSWPGCLQMAHGQSQTQPGNRQDSGAISRPHRAPGQPGSMPGRLGTDTHPV